MAGEGCFAVRSNASQSFAYDAHSVPAGSHIAGDKARRSGEAVRRERKGYRQFRDGPNQAHTRKSRDSAQDAGAPRRGVFRGRRREASGRVGLRVMGQAEAETSWVVRNLAAVHLGQPVPLRSSP